MKTLSISLSIIFWVAYQLPAQKRIDNTFDDRIRLETPLNAYEKDLYLLTGNEEIYFDHPHLRENIKKNIERGIREGIYTGSELNYVNGLKAGKMTLFFYQEKLYKVRWFFDKISHANLSEVAKQLNDYLENNLGKATDEAFVFMKVWNEPKYYLQTFLEDEEFQIEYRNQRVHELIRNLP